MRIAIVAAGALMLASAPAFAQFEGPGASTITTVAEAKDAGDDTKVVLVGRIVAQIGDDDYTFRDETGEVRVEIDDDLWRGRKVTPDMTVRLTGEVDKGLRRIEIDVDVVEIVSEGASSGAGGSQ